MKVRILTALLFALGLALPLLPDNAPAADTGDAQVAVMDSPVGCNCGRC